MKADKKRKKESRGENEKNQQLVDRCAQIISSTSSEKPPQQKLSASVNFPFIPFMFFRK